MNLRIRGRIPSNPERMMRISPMQKGNWRDGMWQHSSKFRGYLRGENGLNSSIIICFRKAQDEPYKCYEDFIFNNGLHHVRIWPLSFVHGKTTVALIIISNYRHDSIRIFYFLLFYM